MYTGTHLIHGGHDALQEQRTGWVAPSGPCSIQQCGCCSAGGIHQWRQCLQQLLKV